MMVSVHAAIRMYVQWIAGTLIIAVWVVEIWKPVKPIAIIFARLIVRGLRAVSIHVVITVIYTVKAWAHVMEQQDREVLLHAAILEVVT
jgi:hypothetical protein